MCHLFLCRAACSSRKTAQWPFSMLLLALRAPATKKQFLQALILRLFISVNALLKPTDKLLFCSQILSLDLRNCCTIIAGKKMMSSCFFLAENLTKNNLLLFFSRFFRCSLSHLDNFTLCLMPMGADFATHAMETAHAFFQGLANYPAWRSAQTDLVCSSKAAARILSALPLGDDHVGSATSSSSEILEDSLHRARMLRMELGSLAALSRATAAQLQAAARISTEAAENLQKFLTSKPCSIS